MEIETQQSPPAGTHLQLALGLRFDMPFDGMFNNRT